MGLELSGTVLGAAKGYSWGPEPVLLYWPDSESLCLVLVDLCLCIENSGRLGEVNLR